ncbi:laminin subunit alpha-2-like, partial [Tachysurus fulvidraco]|uniref:laminin subunit alpha-2-like n=1 Tax=Tachysurus fulvidraco TaxID=1234273 RepID=UPI001FF060CE
MKSPLVFALFPLLFILSSAQHRGLFPAVLNLASMAKISANATCGENRPEMFCKLVEHVPGQPVRNPQCRVCNLRSEKIYERHPIAFAIDGTQSWWQSPSIKNGMDYHYVTITLDLQQVFQIAYIILKAANSPRPGNWVLERSLDGENFMPWQYYAITDTECITRFNIVPRTGPPAYRHDDEVICTSFYSKIHPLENGEVRQFEHFVSVHLADKSKTLVFNTDTRDVIQTPKQTHQHSASNTNLHKHQCSPSNTNIHYQTSSNTIKHHQTPSNTTYTIKHHQTPSN